MRRFTAATLLALAAAIAQPAAQAPVRNFLWTVTAPGAPPSYLLGSVHVLTPEYYPLSPRIEEAFGLSKVLIEEADLDEMSNPATLMGLLTKARLSDGQTLDKVIASDLHGKVMARADKAGLPRPVLQLMKPWVVALMLTQPVLEAAGFKPEHGVDRHFFDRAKKAGMSRRALETLAFQFQRLDGMAPAQQEAMLRSALDELDTQTVNVKALADAWARGDTKTIEELSLASMADFPELYQRMLVERNASWVAPVEECLKEQTSCFVVVGAAHLVGPDSLVAMLQKKGYKVEQQ